MHCDLQPGMHIEKFSLLRQQGALKARLIHVDLNIANLSSVDLQCDISCPNRVIIKGSFSLIPSSVSAAYYRTAVNDVSGEKTKAIRRSYCL